MTPAPENDDADDDLVAYLDGELPEDEARQVESKISQDAASRSRLQNYKKTFDLLDYLPKPEPSPDFATKTLTQVLPNTSSVSNAVGAVVPPSSISLWPWAVAAMVSVIVGLSLGYASRPEPPKPEAITAELIPVVARLPFYAAVDDLDFLKKLDQPELFSDEVSSPNPVRLDRPLSPEQQGQLFEQFRQLSPTRRKQIVELDKQLRELPTVDRDRLGRVLESYSVWLDRLPDTLRETVVSAPGPTERLQAVEMAISKEWRESLPIEKRNQLKTMTDLNEKSQLSRQWLERENERKQEWQLAARQWQSVKDGKKPWPFDQDGLRAELESYVQNVLKTDPNTTRLTKVELEKLERLRKNPERDFGWFLLGTYLLELSERHPSLPEPKSGLITQLNQLPDPVRREFTIKPQLLQRANNVQGRWPEFALLVDIEHRGKKFGTLPSLGAAKPGEFTPTVETFLTSSLFPKLTPKQTNELKLLEGRWPEYPKRLIDLCSTHDLSMPGVMLPGPPSLWKQYYRYTSAKIDKSVGKPNGN